MDTEQIPPFLYPRGLEQPQLPRQVDFVFHGGSGSSVEEIREAISYGVVKMNEKFYDPRVWRRRAEESMVTTSARRAPAYRLVAESPTPGSKTTAEAEREYPEHNSWRACSWRRTGTAVFSAGNQLQSDWWK